MLRRGLCLWLVAALLLPTAVRAAAAPTPREHPPALLARTSGNVSVERASHENPMMEIAQSVFWGAAAGTMLGLAVVLAANGSSAEPLRWGCVIGSFAGLGAGVYFVMARPEPASLLELEDGRLLPAPAPLAAVEALPGGARVRAVGFRF